MALSPKKISQLTPSSGVLPEDLLVAETASGTLKATAEQVHQMQTATSLAVDMEDTLLVNTLEGVRRTSVEGLLSAEAAPVSSLDGSESVKIETADGLASATMRDILEQSLPAATEVTGTEEVILRTPAGVVVTTVANLSDPEVATATSADGTEVLRLKDGSGLVDITLEKALTPTSAAAGDLAGTETVYVVTAAGLRKTTVSGIHSAQFVDGVLEDTDTIVVLDADGSLKRVSGSELNTGGGGSGTDGKSVELQTTATHIQWRQTDGVTPGVWQDLVALADLEGVAGTDGKSVELQTTATHIQWRQTDGVTPGAWQDLVALADLRGSDGSDGLSVELQKSATAIQWRTTDGVAPGAWQDLVLLSEIKGDPGDAGSGSAVPFATKTRIPLGGNKMLAWASSTTTSKSEIRGLVRANPEFAAIPDDCVFLDIQAIGGGSGGAWGSNTGFGGFGGNISIKEMVCLADLPDDSINVTVGLGGAPGNGGGFSSFGSSASKASWVQSVVYSSRGGNTVAEHQTIIGKMQCGACYTGPDQSRALEVNTSLAPNIALGPGNGGSNHGSVTPAGGNSSNNRIESRVVGPWPAGQNGNNAIADDFWSYGTGGSGHSTGIGGNGGVPGGGGGGGRDGNATTSGGGGRGEVRIQAWAFITKPAA